MRLLTLALLGLLPAASLAGAVTRPEAAHAVAPAKASTSKPPMAKSRPGPAQVKASAGHAQARLQQATWRPGAAPATCSHRAKHCSGAGLARTHFGWTRGLPPAALVQASECPDGTMATLARGHDDVVRCMPI